MTWNERIDELNCLAMIDESADYEVDMSAICTDGVKFYFLSASGCSCWDGDYEESAYDSFDELKSALITDDVSTYNPSLTGIRSLLEEAESILFHDREGSIDRDLTVIEWLEANATNK